LLLADWGQSRLENETRFRFWLWMIALLGVIVPCRLRADWKQEWEAELRHREFLLANWDNLNWTTKLALLRRSLGAFCDALLLQPRRLEDEMFQDLRYGLRMLRKDPGFTVIATMILALGMGANTAIFSVVNAVLLRPLPYPDSERLMQVGRAFGGAQDDGALSEQKFAFVRDHTDSFEALTATQGMGPNVYLSNEDQIDYISGLMVSADFFRVVGVSPLSGRGFTEEDSSTGSRVVILGDELWRRRFGADNNIIGQNIPINGTACTVVGIMPPGFEYFGTHDVFVPMQMNPARPNEGHNWTVIGRLKTNVTRIQASAELNTVFERFRDAYPRQVLRNEFFSVVSWQRTMTNSVRELLLILLGAVGLVMLIACINVANLQLTRAVARQKEMAIRSALGAGNLRLLRQLLTESLTLSLLGGSLGLFVAFAGIKTMLAFLPPEMLPRAHEVKLDTTVLGFALAASLLTGIVFSLAPALQTRRIDLNRILKEGGGKSGAGAARGRLRGALVVVEVALALTLTIGAGLLLRTFANLRGIDPGFDPQDVLTFDMAPKGNNYNTVAQLNDFSRRALERLRGLPGVEAAAMTNKLPLAGWFNLPYKLDGQTDWSGSTEYRLVTPNYFEVMKMTMRQGRPFNDNDSVGSDPVIIVNEAFAQRNYPNDSALGQLLCAGCEYGDPAKRSIVGVVNDTKQRNLNTDSPPTVFIPIAQASEGVKQIVGQPSFALRITGDPSRLGAIVQQEMRALEPAAPLRNLLTLEDLIGTSIARQRFNLSLLGAFAGLGVVLAAVGIYGVMSYGVSQRRHEIGIRVALGAQNADVLKLVVRHGMSLAVAGIALGLGASLGLTRLLKSLLFGVSATDTATFVSIAFLLMLVALLACYLPARKATRIDPMLALRQE
jgi:predicted permease